jgi:uncharacterized protein (DUF1499 family)
MKPVIFLTLLLISVVAAAERSVLKHLPPCSGTPNCVSSQAEDSPHYIPPLRIVGDQNQAWEALRGYINEHERLAITHETDGVLHAEATSLFFQFVDDIDAVLDTHAGLIHIRSASRLGHSDFGVNRKRIEEIRKELKKMNVIA